MTTKTYQQPWILVRGGGDIATGTIVRLHHCGFRVIVAECASPSAIRRKASLCEAVYQQTAAVENVVCRRIGDPLDASRVWAQGEIPLLVDEHLSCLSVLKPAALIDAILAKKNLGTFRNMAPITIGLGPGFIAGADVDAVVETKRGHHLGRVILEGPAIANTGIPGIIGGYGAERVIHAPDSGPMQIAYDKKAAEIGIGSIVKKGQTIALVGDTPVIATLDGVLRGLIRPGYPVTKGLKIADIDPRLEQVSCCDTISDKARAVGGGSLEALLYLARKKGICLL